MSVPIRVLSLAGAVQRREAVNAEFARNGLDFRFVDAIDGRRMADAELDLHYDRVRNTGDFKRPLSRGEVACAMGHRAIWKEVAESPAPVVLVCEDDLLLGPAFGGFFRSVAAHKSVFEHVMVKLDGSPRGGEVVARLAGVELVLTRQLPGLTTGYLLGRAAAATLLARERKISRPVDMDLKHYWEHGVPILVARPQLVCVQPRAESGLELSRAAEKPAGWWSRISRNLRYQCAISRGRLRFPLRAERIAVLHDMRHLPADSK